MSSCLRLHVQIAPGQTGRVVETYSAYEIYTLKLTVNSARFKDLTAGF